MNREVLQNADGITLEKIKQVAQTAGVLTLDEIRLRCMPPSWLTSYPLRGFTLEEAAGPQWCDLQVYVEALRAEAQKIERAIPNSDQQTDKAILCWMRITLLNEASIYETGHKRTTNLHALLNHDRHISAAFKKLTDGGMAPDASFLKKSIESISVDLDILLQVVQSYGWLSTQEKSNFLTKLNALVLSLSTLEGGEEVEEAKTRLSQKIQVLTEQFSGISAPETPRLRKTEIEAGLEAMGIRDSIKVLIQLAESEYSAIQAEINRLKAVYGEETAETNPKTEDEATSALTDIKSWIRGLSFGGNLAGYWPDIRTKLNADDIDLASTSPDGKVVSMPSYDSPTWEKNKSRFRQVWVHELFHVLQAHIRPELKNLSSQTGREGMAILAEDLWVQGNPSPAEQIALLEFQKRLTHKWLLSLQYHTEAIDVDHVKEAFPSTWSPIATSPGHIMKYYLGHRLASAYALHGLPEGITPNLTQIFETLAPTTGLFLLPHVLVVDDPTNISLNALLGGRPPLSVLLTQALQPPLERPRQDTSAAVKSVLP